MTQELERFKRVEEIFEAVIRLPADQRAEFLKRECLDESSVREEVEALLAEDSSPRIDAPTRGLANRVDLQAEMPLPALPERIGRYRVIRECGHGGMGTVYEAQQDYPERRVALKMIRPGMMSRNLMKRFRYETEFLGRLQHPGVAQIFDAGVSNIGAGEQPYFVMEFINGSPLLEHLRQRGLDTNARLMLFVMICDAVQHAHQRGIIHRDLKPENILVVPAENDSGSGTGHYASLVGQPKVLDFGIAKATDADVQATIQTDAGALVGTLQYMSPEQATGNSDHLDIRSDIYALGVILFEMLSDKTPYDLAGKNIAESVRVIREQDPSRLSSVDSRFRGDLETIVGKCLEKEPERRYASASDLAGDIRRHLQDEPITARPPSTWYQLRKFSRRNRQLVYGVIATVLALAIGLIGTAIYALRASENAQRAGRSESVALAEAYRANLSAAINLVRTDPITARDYLDRVPQEQRGWEWRHAQSQIDQYDFIYEAPVAAVGELVVVSDGSKVVSVLEDHRIAIWDTESTALRQLLPGDHEISTIAAPRTSDDRLAIGTVDGRVLTWNLTDDKPLEIFRTRDGERIRDLSWSRNGEWLAATAYAVDSSPWPHSYFNARVVLFKNGSLHHEFKLGNNKHLPGLAFNHDGSKLAIILVTSRYIPGTLSIIDIETLSIERSLQIADYPLSVTYSDDGEQIYVGTDQRTIVPVDSTSLRQLGRITGHVHRVSDVEFQPHGDLVASSSLDKTIRLWNGKAGKSMAVINTNGTSEVTDIVFNKDGSRLLYNLDGRIYSWSLLADSSVVLRKHKTYVYYVAWSDNGLWLASAALNEPDACIWEANTGELIRNYEYPAACFGIQFLDNGTGLLSGNTILDTTTGQIKARGEDVVLGRQFSRLFSVDDSGRRFAKVQETQGMQNITVYDLPDQRRFTGWTGAPEWELARFDGTYDTLSLSHDGKILAATRMYESEIVVWDVEHRQQLATLIGHTSSVYTLDFSPDGSRLASGSNDNSIRIWDTTTWQQVADLRGHEQYVMNVAFSPDGTRLASASGDHTVRIWDTIPRFERARQARDMAERMDRLRPRIQSLVDELGETRNVTKELLYYFKDTEDLAAAMRVLIAINLQNNNSNSETPEKLQPQALWEFGSNSATFDDRYYNHNHATPRGDTQWVKDELLVRSGAVEFNGKGDGLQVPDASSLSLTGNLTIAAWIRVDEFANQHTIVGKTQEDAAAPFQFFLSSESGVPVLELGNGSTTASAPAIAPPEIGRWEHVAVTRSGKEVIHYLNGLPNGRTSISATTDDKRGMLTIGNCDDFSSAMKGRLDSLALYNKALTPKQVMAIAKDRDKDFDGIPDEIDQ